MNYKNLLLAIGNDPMQINHYGKKLLNFEEGDTEDSVWVRISSPGKESGDIILKQSISTKSTKNKEQLKDDCCRQLLMELLVRGAKSLHASHSGPFLQTR